MAIRREMFRDLDQNVGEDFVLPIQSALSGYKTIFDPRAISREIL